MSRRINSNLHHAGEVRPTQLLFTYGVGAIVDLPYLSALVMGLDDWTGMNNVQPISEERLLAAVQQQLGEQVQQLLPPPVPAAGGNRPTPTDPDWGIGVPVVSFPRWLLCTRCQRLAPLSSNTFQLEADDWRPERSKYVHRNCQRSKNAPAVPARFLVACPHGHLDDFPWFEFVHGGVPCERPLLRLIESGASGEARDLVVRCDSCGQRQSMALAFGDAGQRTMPFCRGRHPHLRSFADEDCDTQVSAILLGATNLWFPDTLTSISLPTVTDRLGQLIEQQWAQFQSITSQKNVSQLRLFGALRDVAIYSDEDIWQAIERRQRPVTVVQPEVIDLKTPEWNVFSNPASAPNGDDLQLRQVNVPDGFAGLIEKVVLVERLREVRALTGFTRILAPGDNDDEVTSGAGQRVPLARQAPRWVPASDVRGEGIFIQFNEAALQEWLERDGSRDYNRRFVNAHAQWRGARDILPVDGGYPGLRYILLHTFSHALMRQLSLECGYSAASLRERIYASDPAHQATVTAPMAGVLIYTSASDSEGTFGGLVALGQPAELGNHLQAALREAQLCASDPLCAEHTPEQNDGNTIHGAACHACLFAPETSCEKGNRYLDRSVLVATVEGGEVAYFA